MALAWPKKLSSNPKRYLHTQQPKEVLAYTAIQNKGKTIHSPQMGKNQNFQHGQGKTQPTNVEINNQPTSMSPQHTIPNVNAGELTQVEMGKEPIPNLYVREKNAANRMVEENTAPIHDGVIEHYTV